MKRAPKSRFCVINDTINGSPRNVAATEAAAIEHAMGILQDDARTSRHRKTVLYVVEIKKVVSFQEAPICCNRPINVKVTI